MVVETGIGAVCGILLAAFPSHLRPQVFSRLTPLQPAACCPPHLMVRIPGCRFWERSPGPPGLANIVYEPLCFFSTPLKGDCAPRPSYLDEMCELEIKIKELELLTITGDASDSQKYTFLKSVKDKKMQDMKAWQVLQKQTFAS
ncbi:hypothetical protein FKM82_003333 [Ascaphus truei]